MYYTCICPPASTPVATPARERYFCLILLSPPMNKPRWRQFATTLQKPQQGYINQWVILNLLESYLHLDKLSNCRQNVINVTQLMDLQRILNPPSRAPSEVPHTYPGTPVQATQSSQSTQPIGDSPPSTPTRRNLETSRDLRLMIRTALLFKRPYKEIYQVLGIIEY